jgi:DNA-binding CsgD family transcriptional regulator
MADLQQQTAFLDALTFKQREVLLLVSEGLTSKEIARKLGISESAVNQRIEVIRQRLGGMSRASIARLYRDTNTLKITIPTSNSRTGKAIQLQADGMFDHQLTSEGVEGFGASADEANDELQPSTLPSWLHGTSAMSRRMLTVVGLAIGILCIAVLLLAVGHSLALIALGPR